MKLRVCSVVKGRSEILPLALALTFPLYFIILISVMREDSRMMVGRVRIEILIVFLARMNQVGILKFLLMFLRHFLCGVKRETTSGADCLHLCAKTAGPQKSLLLVFELQEVFHEGRDLIGLEASNRVPAVLHALRNFCGLQFQSWLAQLLLNSGHHG